MTKQRYQPSHAATALRALRRTLSGPMQAMVWLSSLAGTGLLFWLDAQGISIHSLTNQWVYGLAILGPVSLVLLLLDASGTAPTPT